MSTSATEKLPAAISTDGWNDDYQEATADRPIQGTILRCVDGHWSDRDGRNFPADVQLLALATTEVCQHWEGSGEDAKLLETIVKRPGHPLPSITDLNGKIPESEWATDLNGNPRPPWQRAHVVYFLAEGSAERFTYINSTIGARIAVEALRDKVKWMRAMRGESVVPFVRLSNKPMKTKFGQKLRPDFEIVSWVELGVGIASEQPEPKALPTDEERRAAGLIPEGHTGGRTKPKRGAMPVKPVSYAEDLNDEIPD
jgi:hypothetical protein